MKSNILIVGSTNTDMVVKTGHLPRPGETILGGTFFMNPGGKGANQAVAAGRLQGRVVFICKVGCDIFGEQSVKHFSDAGIDTSCVFQDPVEPSGVALITVDEHGENCIVVASGANATLSSADISKAASRFDDAEFVLMQLETPLDTVQHAAKLAHSKNVKVILNPAPACALPDALLQLLEVITPNETEAELLTGIQIIDLDSAKKAAIVLRLKGVQTVIITLGSKGALVYHQDRFTHIASMEVKAVDTTAAGDVFNGALVVALSQGKPMLEAVRFACKAAAISVTRLGAQASAPYLDEVESFSAGLPA